jgi:carbon monoxide dehydrogenase subunit G
MRIGQSNTGETIPRGLGWLFALALAVAGGHALAADPPFRSLDVAYEGDAYILNAVIIAPVPQAVAWDVLTDFDHMAQWVPNVAESKATARDGNAVTVQQHGVAKFGAASFPYTTERRIDLKPPSAIKTTQLKGSMRRVESTLQIEPDGKGTRINYHLEIVPSGLASAVMSKKFLEHEITEQFGAIVGEMTHRAP